MRAKENSLNIVLCGYWSGLSSEVPKKAESEIMKEYLISHGIPEKVILTEKKSKDTLANIICGWPILDEIKAEEDKAA